MVITALTMALSTAVLVTGIAFAALGALGLFALYTPENLEGRENRENFLDLI